MGDLGSAKSSWPGAWRAGDQADRGHDNDGIPEKSSGIGVRLKAAGQVFGRSGRSRFGSQGCQIQPKSHYGDIEKSRKVP